MTSYAAQWKSQLLYRENTASWPWGSDLLRGRLRVNPDTECALKRSRIVAEIHNVLSNQTSRGNACGNQAFHVLCKANEIFVVGIDVGDLDVDQ